jgi:hypothetical protein
MPVLFAIMPDVAEYANPHLVAWSRLLIRDLQFHRAPRGGAPRNHWRLPLVTQGEEISVGVYLRGAS